MTSWATTEGYASRGSDVKETSEVVRTTNAGGREWYVLSNDDGLAVSARNR